MLNTIQNAKLTEERRLNQMIQEQCRTRCGTGGGRFANAVTAVSKLVGGSARSGAGEEAIASWCESETCSELTTERSIGRMLQLQVRGCHVSQLSLATANTCGLPHVAGSKGGWRAGWRPQVRIGSSSPRRRRKSRSVPAEGESMQPQGTGKGTADRMRWMGDGSQHA